MTTRPPGAPQGRRSRVAYLGPPGTYTQEAAARYAPDAEFVPFPTAGHVCAAVESGEVDEAVVPIENSLYGSIVDILDFLITAKRAKIKSEILLPVKHCLMAAPGTRVEDVRAVLSHPQALGQCRGYLAKHLPRAEQVAALSNAAAAAEVKAGTRFGAEAIGPLRAAGIYGLNVLAEGIQDANNNITRFVVLAPEDHPRTGRDRTSLCYDVRDEPGALYKTLGPIARRGINLSKIESRPSGIRLGRYIFLADIDGHRSDPEIAAALEEIRQMTQMMKVLGSYPRAELPETG